MNLRATITANTGIPLTFYTRCLNSEKFRPYINIIENYEGVFAQKIIKEVCSNSTINGVLISKEIVNPIKENCSLIQNYLRNVYSTKFTHHLMEKSAALSEIMEVYLHPINASSNLSLPDEQEISFKQISEDLKDSLIEYIGSKNSFYRNFVAFTPEKYSPATLKENIKSGEFKGIKSAILKDVPTAKDYYNSIVDFDENRILFFHELTKINRKVKYPGFLPISNIDWMPALKEVFETSINAHIDELFSTGIKYNN